MDTGKQGLVGEGFEPCAHFQGARPGFVFKRGLWGVGYYHDLLAAPREAQPPPRAPDGVVRPQPQRCHYEVLGVAMEANDDELRRAYRRLALKWHPDKNAGNTETASAKFKEIQGAYAVLSDPQERAWYNDHREDILHGRSCAADDASFEEEPGVNVWAYFTAGCYRGFGGDAGGFYAVYAGLFDELEAEERAVHAQAREAPHRAPPFGGPDAPWASVQRFYAHWEVFSTARVCGYADMYDPHQAPNRQSRRTMEKENLRCRAEARRKHTECVRALVAYVRKRDKRVAAHEAEHAAEQASRPSKKHAARVLALQQELAQLEAEEAAVAAEEAEAEEGAEAEAAGEAAHASREAAATASRTEADGSNAAPAADDEEEDDEDDEDEEDDAALLRLASAAVATKTGGGGRGGQQGEDTEEDDDDEEEEDEDALLRMAAMGGGRRPAAPAKVAADAAQALPLPEDATAAAPPAAPPTPPKPAPPGAKDTQLVVPDLHMTLDVAAPPAGTRQAGRPKGKGKQKDPAALAAAAAAAEGMRQRRAADGLGCKVCGLVFANRSLLLKHIEKTGHIVDPTRRTGMETGLHWIAPDDDQPTKQELMQMKKINDARAKKGRNRAAQNHRDSDPDF